MCDRLSIGKRHNILNYCHGNCLQSVFLEIPHKEMDVPMCDYCGYGCPNDANALAKTLELTVYGVLTVYGFNLEC